MNVTGETLSDDGSIPEAAFNITAVYLGLLTFFGILNNGLVLVLYGRYKTLRNPINLFLINISVGDLSVSILGSPFTFAANVGRGWLFGVGGCTWYAFIVTVCGTEQIVSLAAVSMQRCCLVVRPFTARKMNTQWALIFIAITWIYSLLVSIPPALGWNSYVLEGTNTACSVDWTSNDPTDVSYIIFIFVMVMVIPLTLIVGSYTLLIYAVKKISSSEAAQSSQNKADKKVTILIVVMISCFLVAWTPYATFSLYVTASKNNSISPITASLPAMFAKSCTVYNPIIYFLLNKQFKEAFIDMVCCGRNPFQRDEDIDNQHTLGRARTEATRDRAPGRRQEMSVSMDTQVSEIAPTGPPMRHIRTADWCPQNEEGQAASTSGQQRQGEPAAGSKGKKGNTVEETPVEVFQVEDEEPSEAAKEPKPVIKKPPKGFKRGKVCPGPVEPQQEDEKL